MVRYHEFDQCIAPCLCVLLGSDLSTLDHSRAFSIRFHFEPIAELLKVLVELLRHEKIIDLYD